MLTVLQLVLAKAFRMSLAVDKSLTALVETVRVDLTILGLRVGSEREPVIVAQFSKCRATGGPKDGLAAQIMKSLSTLHTCGIFVRAAVHPVRHARRVNGAGPT